MLLYMLISVVVFFLVTIYFFSRFICLANADTLQHVQKMVIARCDILDKRLDGTIKVLNDTIIFIDTRLIGLIDSCREKCKQVDLAELFEKKETIKTALEMLYYHTYVTEKKKNLDFPEEKKKICEILPLINLSIADKIDVGRILVYHKFNTAFPLIASPNTYVNMINQEPYIKDDNIYITFTRITKPHPSQMTEMITYSYNMTLGTHVVQENLGIDRFFSSIYDYTTTDVEKKRIDDRNKILHQLEQP